MLTDGFAGADDKYQRSRLKSPHEPHPLQHPAEPWTEARINLTFRQAL